MIDFLKIIIKNIELARVLPQNPLLEFTSIVVEETGELKNAGRGKVAEYRNMKFSVYDSGTIIIRGSLHKYHNNGRHNYNDFHFNDIIKVIHELQKTFEIDIDAAEIKNLEFGVNITMPVDTRCILANCLFHKTEPFKYKSVPNDGECYEATHEQYIVKIYNKAKQHKLNYQLLRFELKYIRMSSLNKIGIYNLSDLLKPEIYPRLLKILLQAWDNILFLETHLETHGITIKQKQQCEKWNNPRTWYKIIEKSHEKRYKNLFNREREKYRTFTTSHSPHVQRDLRELFRVKWGILTDISGYVEDNFTVKNTTPIYTKESENDAAKNRRKINHSYIEINFTHSMKLSIKTGLPLSLHKDHNKPVFKKSLKIQRLLSIINTVTKFIKHIIQFSVFQSVKF